MSHEALYMLNHKLQESEIKQEQRMFNFLHKNKMSFRSKQGICIWTENDILAVIREENIIWLAHNSEIPKVILLNFHRFVKWVSGPQ